MRIGTIFLHTLIGNLAKEFDENFLAREPWTSSRLSSKDDAASEETHSVGEMVCFWLTLDSLGFELVLVCPLHSPCIFLAILTQEHVEAQAYQGLSGQTSRRVRLMWRTMIVSKVLCSLQKR